MFPHKNLTQNPNQDSDASQLFILCFPSLDNLRMLDVVSKAYQDIFPMANIYGIAIESEEQIEEPEKIEEFVGINKIKLIETIRHIQKNTFSSAEYTALVGSGPIGSAILSLLGLSTAIAGRVITFNSFIPSLSIGTEVSLDYTTHLIYTRTECEFADTRIRDDFEAIKSIGADITLDILGVHEDPIDVSINRLKTCIPLKIIKQIQQ